MQYRLCLITVALAPAVLATDVNLTLYANGIDSGDDITCSNQQVTYQYNNLPSFGVKGTLFLHRFHALLTV